MYLEYYAYECIFGVGKSAAVEKGMIGELSRGREVNYQGNIQFSFLRYLLLCVASM